MPPRGGPRPSAGGVEEDREGRGVHVRAPHRGGAGGGQPSGVRVVRALPRARGPRRDASPRARVRCNHAPRPRGRGEQPAGLGEDQVR